jgi:CheY-like chemotaxis protein
MEKQHFITIIQKSGDRLLNTVNDLIDISKIETGQMPVVIDELQIVDQLSNLHQFFKPQATEKNLRFLFKNEIPDENAVIKTDMTKFDSIVTNLIKNAIKYTDYGTIELGCFITNTMISVYVKDTGIGIPENRQTAVFNRFEQADIGDRRAYQGSGLGLAIVKAYAEMLGGSITLKSKEGEGSTFTFSFQPVPNDNDLSSGSFKNSAITGTTALNSGLKIAIAEDDDASFLYLKSILKEISSSIISCVNGVEVVEQCRQNPDIDVVLMDIRMPVLNGYEATRQIREFNKEVKIIAQTAFALVGDREKAFQAGCNGYISKPVQKNKLLDLINKISKKN